MKVHPTAGYPQSSDIWAITEERGDEEGELSNRRRDDRSNSDVSASSESEASNTSSYSDDESGEEDPLCKEFDDFYDNGVSSSSGPIVFLSKVFGFLPLIWKDPKRSAESNSRDNDEDEFNDSDEGEEGGNSAEYFNVYTFFFILGWICLIIYNGVEISNSHITTYGDAKDHWNKVVFVDREAVHIMHKNTSIAWRFYNRPCIDIYASIIMISATVSLLYSVARSNFFSYILLAFAEVDRRLEVGRRIYSTMLQSSITWFVICIMLFCLNATSLGFMFNDAQTSSITDYFDLMFFVTLSMAEAFRSVSLLQFVFMCKSLDCRYKLIHRLLDHYSGEETSEDEDEGTSSSDNDYSSDSESSSEADSDTELTNHHDTRSRNSSLQLNSIEMGELRDRSKQVKKDDSNEDHYKRRSNFASDRSDSRASKKSKVSVGKNSSSARRTTGLRQRRSTQTFYQTILQSRFDNLFDPGTVGGQPSTGDWRKGSKDDGNTDDSLSKDEEMKIIVQLDTIGSIFADLVYLTQDINTLSGAQLFIDILATASFVFMFGYYFAVSVIVDGIVYFPFLFSATLATIRLFILGNCSQNVEENSQLPYLSACKMSSVNLSTHPRLERQIQKTCLQVQSDSGSPKLSAAGCFSIRRDLVLKACGITLLLSFLIIQFADDKDVSKSQAFLTRFIFGRDSNKTSII